MPSFDPGVVLDRLVVPTTVTVRTCAREDLPSLEWFGCFTAHREIL